ncbi:MAG: anhydro-N-acetylmuramic acid kinase [Puia sp.]|nr:anhydro-N-acetylmuramic acid kinase [Puia sp.]
MVYKVIGLMSGSSLDGLDIAYIHLHENAGKWSFTFIHTACYEYPDSWRQKLAGATSLSALDYQLLHAEYGHYLGERVNHFIGTNALQYQVQLISSHGHTTFHRPASRMTAQLGDGAALAAVTGINTVSDLRAMDLALGGQGAPIVPIGEKWLLKEYDWFLNLGGIANLSHHRTAGDFVAFDVCPANRVLDQLAAEEGMRYDPEGSLAAKGRLDIRLLEALNALPYYSEPYPKSLANEFGTGTVRSLIAGFRLPVADALRTCTEHIAIQVKNAILLSQTDPAASAISTISATPAAPSAPRRLLVTGGGAHNTFLVGRLREYLAPLQIEPVIPAPELIDYKEALVMALIGVLRWREEYNVLASVTGASRNSIGGALWIGQS